MSDKNLRGLYDALAKDGYKMPDYEKYADSMQDTTKQKELYEALSKDGYSMPEFGKFSSSMAKDKKSAEEMLGERVLGIANKARKEKGIETAAPKESADHEIPLNDDEKIMTKAFADNVMQGIAKTRADMEETLYPARSVSQMLADQGVIKDDGSPRYTPQQKRHMDSVNLASKIGGDPQKFIDLFVVPRMSEDDKNVDSYSSFGHEDINKKMEGIAESIAKDPTLIYNYIQNRVNKRNPKNEEERNKLLNEEYSKAMQLIYQGVTDTMVEYNMPRNYFANYLERAWKGSLMGTLASNISKYSSKLVGAMGGTDDWETREYLANKGNELYDIKHGTNMFDNVARGVGSIMIDFLPFKGFGAVGNLLGKGAGWLTGEMLTRGVTEQAAKQFVKRQAANSFMGQALQGSLRTGATLSLYGGTQAALSQTLAGEYDPGEIASEMGTQFALGAAIGTMGVGKAAMVKNASKPVRIAADLANPVLTAQVFNIPTYMELHKKGELTWENVGTASAEGTATMFMLEAVPLAQKIKSRYNIPEAAVFHLDKADIDLLKNNGYDIGSILDFKKGKTAKPTDGSAPSADEGISFREAAEGKQSEKATTEANRIKADYDKAMNNPDIPLTVKAKLQYLMTGTARNIVPQVVKAEKSGNDVRTYDAQGNLVEVIRGGDYAKISNACKRKQVELSERMNNETAMLKSVYDTCKVIAKREGRAAEDVYSDYCDALSRNNSGEKLGAEEGKLLNEVKWETDKVRHSSKGNSGRIKDAFKVEGHDIDKLLKKNNRSKEEDDIVEKYIDTVQKGILKDNSKSPYEFRVDIEGKEMEVTAFNNDFVTYKDEDGNKKTVERTKNTTIYAKAEPTIEDYVQLHVEDENKGNFMKDNPELYADKVEALRSDLKKAQDFSMKFAGKEPENWDYWSKRAHLSEPPMQKQYVEGREADGEAMAEIQGDYAAKRKAMCDAFGLKEDGKKNPVSEFLTDHPMDVINNIKEPEKKKVAEDYLSSFFRYAGMRDRIRGRIEEAAKQSDDAIMNMRHGGDGMLHPAVTKDGRNVHVVSGDMSQPVGTLVIRDDETGDREMIDVSDIAELGNADTVEAGQAKARKSIGDAIEAEETAKMAIKPTAKPTTKEPTDKKAAEEGGKQSEYKTDIEDIIAFQTKKGLIKEGDGQADSMRRNPDMYRIEAIQKSLDKAVSYSRGETEKKPPMWDFWKERKGLEEPKAAETEAEEFVVGKGLKFKYTDSDATEYEFEVTGEKTEDGKLKVSVRANGEFQGYQGMSEENIKTSIERGAFEVENNGSAEPIGDLPTDAPKEYKEGMTFKDGDGRSLELMSKEDNGLWKTKVTDKGGNVSEAKYSEQWITDRFADGTFEKTEKEAQGESAEDEIPKAMPMDKDGNPDFMATTPQVGHDFLYGESGFTKKQADETVKANIDKYTAEVNKLNANPPKMGADFAKNKKAISDHEQKSADARKALDYWQAVKAHRDSRPQTEEANTPVEETTKLTDETLPLDKNGNIAYEKVDPRQFFEYLKEKYGEKEAVHAINDIVMDYQDKMEKLNVLVGDWQTRLKKRNHLMELKEKQNAWREVLPKVEKKEAVKSAEPTQEKKAKQVKAEENPTPVPEKEEQGEVVAQSQTQEKKGETQPKAAKESEEMKEAREKYGSVREAADVLDDMEAHTPLEAASELLTAHHLLLKDVGTGSGRKRGYLSETGYSQGEAKAMFGLFRTEEKGGLSVQQLGELLEVYCEREGIGLSAGEGTNVIIDLLSQCRTRADITRYIERNRIREAEEMFKLLTNTRPEELAEEDAYNAYVKYCEEELKELAENFNEGEFNSILADENNYGTNGQSERERESGGGSTDMVRPAQVDNEGRDKADEGGAGVRQETGDGMSRGEEAVLPKADGSQEGITESTGEKVAAAESETDTNPTEAQKASEVQKEDTSKNNRVDGDIEEKTRKILDKENPYSDYANQKIADIKEAVDKGYRFEENYDYYNKIKKYHGYDRGNGRFVTVSKAEYDYALSIGANRPTEQEAKDNRDNVYYSYYNEKYQFYRGNMRPIIDRLEKESEERELSAYEKRELEAYKDYQRILDDTKARDKRTRERIREATKEYNTKREQKAREAQVREAGKHITSLVGKTFSIPDGGKDTIKILGVNKDDPTKVDVERTSYDEQGKPTKSNDVPEDTYALSEHIKRGAYKEKPSAVQQATDMVTGKSAEAPQAESRETIVARLMKQAKGDNVHEANLAKASLKRMGIELASEGMKPKKAATAETLTPQLQAVADKAGAEVDEKIAKIDNAIAQQKKLIDSKRKEFTKAKQESMFEETPEGELALGDTKDARDKNVEAKMRPYKDELTVLERDRKALVDGRQRTIDEAVKAAKSQGNIFDNINEGTPTSVPVDETILTTEDRKEKIEDAGEKIGGARKDMVQKYADKINLEGETFSKLFPSPDIDKLIENGLSIDDAASVKAMYDNAKLTYNTFKKARNKDFARRAALFYAKYAKQVLNGIHDLDMDYAGVEFTEYGKRHISMMEKSYQALYRQLGTGYAKLDLSAYPIYHAEDLPKGVDLESLNAHNQELSDKMGYGKKYLPGNKVKYILTRGYSSVENQFLTEEDVINAFIERVKKETTLDVPKYKTEMYYKREHGRTNYDKIYIGAKIRGFGTVDIMEFNSSKEANAWYDNHGEDFQQMAAAKEETLRNSEDERLPKYKLGYKHNKATHTYQVIASFSSTDVVLKEFKDSNTDENSYDGITYKKVRDYMNSDQAIADADKAAMDIMNSRKAKRNLKTEMQKNERVGVDYRKGKDVSAQDLMDTFGFRAVEFGNYATQKDRQDFLNSMYDAMMDMAEILHVSPQALSLNKKLAIAYGARGRGAAKAHYEPYRNVINITKTSGNGALAHEWLHALDAYFAGKTGQNEAGSYSTNGEYKDDTRKEIKDAFDNLMKTIKHTEYYTRSANLDDGWIGKYYSKETELAARALQDYMVRELDARGKKNTFLSNHVEIDGWAGNTKNYPFPMGEEVDEIKKAIDNLFNTIQEKVDEQTGNPILYREGIGELTDDEITDKKANNSIDRHAAKLSNEFHSPIFVAHTIDEVTHPQARAAIEAGRNIKGWFDPTTGETVIYEPNATSEGDVTATFFHEVVAHKGLRDMFGTERFGKLCDDVWKSMDTSTQEAYKKKYGNDTRRMADEYMADLSENPKEIGKWKQLVAQVRNFFRDVLGLKMTDKDIEYMLWRSANRLRGNDKGVMFAAEDVVRKQEAIVAREVYHGSGADFDKFDHSHMGEGEGAQAFGWGTYVTEVEGIGRQYAKNPLQGKPTYKINNNGYWVEVSTNNPEYDIVSSTYDLINDRGLTSARKFAERWSQDAEKEEVRNKWKDILQVLNNHKKSDFKQLQPKKHLYNVDIPDNDGTNYLEWDGRADKILDRCGITVKQYEKNDMVNGNDIYRYLADKLGSDKKASEYLSQRGFVGIEYPAESLSGGRKDGAKNYVIFNDKDLQITDHIRFREGDTDDNDIRYQNGDEETQKLKELKTRMLSELSRPSLTAEHKAKLEEDIRGINDRIQQKFMDNNPMPEQGEGESDADYDAKLRKWHDDLTEARRREDKDDAKLLEEYMDLGSDKKAMTEKGAFAQKMGEVGVDVSPDKLKQYIKEEIYNRRRYIETSNWDDIVAIRDIKKNTTEEERKALPFIIEGTYQGHVSPKLKAVADKIRKWYDYQHTILAKEGILYTDQYVKNYVTHIWDMEGSPLPAKKDYATYIRQNTPYAKERILASYEVGLQLGMKMKYDDITDIMAEYGKYANMTVANRRFITFLNNLDIVSDDGSRVPVLIPYEEKNPDYEKMENSAMDDYRVHKSAARMINIVMGQKGMTTWKPIDVVANVWDINSSVLKKINLSLSGFHHLALTEGFIASVDPHRALKALAKDIFWDSVVRKKGNPAFHDPKATRDALNHLVQLGASNDWSVKSVQNITTKLAELAKGDPLAYGAFKTLDWGNKAMDTVLWNYLHDGYKIYYFQHMAKQIRVRAEKKGTSEADLNKQLDEAGQYVNDTFGGQHWDVLGIDRRAKTVLGRLLLSPDWTVSTMRHFASQFGFGQLYNDDKFWKKWFKADDIARVRKHYGRLFWGKAAIYSFVLFNGLNAIFRKDDEDEEKAKADKKRETDPDYKSPYEMAWPDGMPWWAYTMAGNAEGQKTHLFTGRYEDGKETYVRWGKQFREVPELFFGRDGFSFPGPIIDRIAAKMNPNFNMLSNLIGGKSLGGFDNPYMQNKHGWEKEVGRLYSMASAYTPFSIPTQEDKQWETWDLFMPTSSGYSKYKGLEGFKTGILSGDMDIVSAVYKSCVLNHIDPQPLFDAASKEIESTANAERIDGVEDAGQASKLFDKEQDMGTKEKLRNYLRKQQLASAHSMVSQEEILQQAEDFVKNGSTDKEEDKGKAYLRLSQTNDVVEDTHLTSIMATLRKCYNEYMEYAESDPEMANMYAAAHERELEAFRLAKKTKSDISKESKAMDKALLPKQMEMMDSIRATRKRTLDKIAAMK